MKTNLFPEVPIDQPIVDSIPREGNVTIDPKTARITHAGSAKFNESMATGYAKKIWFQLPNSKGGDDCFASYNVDKDEFHLSEKVVDELNVSQPVINRAVSMSKMVAEIARHRWLIRSYNHG